MYPVIKEGVSLGTFSPDSESVRYYIESADGETYEISYKLWKALINADGTKPLDLPYGGKDEIPTLKKYGLIQTSRFVRCKGVFNRFILFPVSRRIQDGSLLWCRAINAALPIVSVMVFLTGIYLTAAGGFDMGGNYSTWLCYFILLFTIVIHESGHMAAGLSYGYRISDVGILLLGIIPVGGYVAHENKTDASKSEQIQVALAGVEGNLLSAGICLIVGAFYYPLSLTLAYSAYLNVVLTLINLIPASGLDGEALLSACGVNNPLISKFLLLMIFVSDIVFIFIILF